MTEEQLNNMPLGSLLTLALDDLEKCEADPKYVINMRTWVWSDTTTCSVCLAGTVLAQELGWTSAIDTKIPVFARTLDYLRVGTVKDHYQMGRAITPYHEDPVAFKRELRQLASELVEARI